MNNSKLIRLLKTFTKLEFREFQKFVESPYFSPGRDLSGLLKVLKKYYPGFAGRNFTAEKISVQLGKNGKPAGKSLLKMQMSELYKMAEQFISLEGWKTQPGLNTYFFANLCKKKGLYDMAEARIRKEISNTHETGIDWRYYQNYHFSKVELVNLLFLKDKPIEAIENVNILSETVLHQFLSFAMRYIYNLVFFSVGHNKAMEGNLLLGFFSRQDLSELLKMLQQKNDIYSRASSVYLLFIIMQLNYMEDERYFTFKETLLKNIDLFSDYEKSFFLQTVLLRTEFGMSGRDHKKYTEESFEIIKYRLSKNLYKQYPDAPYTSVEYFNALYIAFILKEFKWMEEYTSTYLAEVPEEHRYAAGKLSEAFLKFGSGDHKGALQIISQITGLPFLLNYELKRLQLMAYYELNMTDEIFYGADAFKGYLKSNKNVSDVYMQSNIGFVKYFLLLARYKLGEVEMNFDSIIPEIEGSAVASKDWLLEKISEIIP